MAAPNGFLQQISTVVTAALNAIPNPLTALNNLNKPVEPPASAPESERRRYQLDVWQGQTAPDITGLDLLALIPISGIDLAAEMFDGLTPEGQRKVALEHANKARNDALATWRRTWSAGVMRMSPAALSGGLTAALELSDRYRLDTSMLPRG